MVALPRNLRVMALILAGFVTRRFSVPRSMAVLRSDVSVCSKPCRNSTGSVSWTATLMPLPVASGLSSGMLLTEPLTRLLGELLGEGRWPSNRGGRVALAVVGGMVFVAEALVPDLISTVAHDHLLLSGAEVMEVRALLVGDRGTTRSSVVWGGVKWVSMKERRKRLALSRGPASFSNITDRLVVWRLRRDGSGLTRAMWMRCGRRPRPWKMPRRAREGVGRWSGM